MPPSPSPHFLHPSSPPLRAPSLSPALPVPAPRPRPLRLPTPRTPRAHHAQVYLAAQNNAMVALETSIEQWSAQAMQMNDAESTLRESLLQCYTGVPLGYSPPAGSAAPYGMPTA